MAEAGRVLWVTGAGSGMGRAAAVAAGAAGRRVALSGRRAEALEEVGEAVRAAGGDALVVPLDVTDVAVVTAGNYEQYFTVGGKYYGHIIDPHTGYPATGLRSVTIICPDVELADALDDAVFVLGPERGLALINRLKDINCTLITDDGRTLVSKGMQLNPYHSAAPAAATQPKPKS